MTTPGTSARTGLRLAAMLWTALLLAFFPAIAAAGPAQAAAPRQSIRVVADDNYPPFIFRAEDGTLKGILVDQWALWEKKTGIRVRLDAMDWEKAQQRMGAGDEDVIDTLFASPERKAVYDFTKPYARIDVPIFFSRELSGIRGPEDLSGFVVGAKAGDNSIQILKARGVTNFVLFRSYKEVVEAARDGRIKVFTVDKPPALYYLIQMGIQDRFRESAPLYSGELHRAVHKGDTALLEMVQRGFDAISQREYQAIDRRWYGAPIITRRDFTIAGIILAGSAGALGLMLLWVWMLRRIVAQRTAELTRSQDAIRASEAQNRAMISAIPDLIFMNRRDGEFLAVYASDPSQLLAPPEAFLHRKPEDVLPGPLAELFQKAFAQAFDADALQEIEYAIPLGGKKEYFEARIAPCTGDRVITIVRNKTRHKRAEEELRESEMRLRAIADSALDAILLMDQDGRISYWNLAAARILGYRADEAIGMDLHQFLAPKRYHGAFQQGFAGFHSTGMGHAIGTTSVMEAIHKDGHEIPIELSLSALELHGDWHAVGILRDITERKASLEALGESEAQNRAMISAIPDLIFIFSREGEYLAVHASIPALLIAPKEALLHRSVGDVLPGPVSAQFMKVIAKALDLGAVQELQYSLPIDGEEKRFEARLAPYARRTVIAIVRDVTENKRIEEQQRNLQAQFQQAQKMESLGILAGGVAHDMNNVLGAILGLASANIESQAPGSKVHKAFDTIIKAAERGGKMVSSLLSFARQNPDEVRELDVNALLREEFQLLEHTTLSQVQVKMELDPGVVPIRGDASALTNVFMNLCVNAVDAMSGKGTLTLRTLQLGQGWIEVQVEDTGIGMSKEVLEKALDPFFTTKKPGKGTGLGLSMAYSTVKAHHGKLEIQSEPGHGTCVKMSFPAAMPAEASPEPETGPHPEPAARVLNLMLVDDDELIRSSVHALLEILGHDATVVSSGEEALERIQRGARPDVVILDMNMPGLGGAGTVPRLRALLPEVPILIATGRVDQTVMNLLEKYPALTLLPKPFRMVELQNHLHGLVRE